MTLAAFPHEREHRLNHSYGSKNVDRKLSSYLLQWGLLDRRLQTVSGIVYENIDRADIVLNLGDHRRYFFIIGDIENPGERSPRNLVVKPLSAVPDSPVRSCRSATSDDKIRNVTFRLRKLSINFLTRNGER